MHLTLLIPELLWPEPADQAALDQLACPTLEKLLGRARFQRQPRQALETCLAGLLGTGPRSLAACRLAGESRDPGESSWYCADPVHLQFHHERIILGNAELLALQTEEVEQLLASLNRDFPDLGRFHAPHPQRWYLEAVPGLNLPPLPPPSAATGRQLGALLPEAPDLARLLNELQMLLHTHPVNRAREASGRPLVNGLWLWGGTGQAATAPGPERVWGDEPLLQGLARSSARDARPRPPHAQAWLAASKAGGNPRELILLEQLLAPALVEDGDSWKIQMADLERNWIAPLAQALGRELSGLTLLSPTAYGLLQWELGAASRWQFWKSARPLAALARQLADSPP